MSFKKITYILFVFILFGCSVCFASELNLYSEATILVDADSGYILDEKNSNEKIFPASTTKVLTSIIAIENLDLDKAIVVTKSGVSIPWDSSKIYLEPEEVISVKDLLYGTLISSGNDAANMLAEAVSGSVDEFVKLMNEKAKSLGCTGTNFVNAHGYHDKNHYTTAKDMTIILRYAMQNENFRKICETAKYTIPATNKSKERILINTNRLILTKEQSVHALPYEYALGGKTGYTDKAGRCFVGWAKKGDKYLISCIFNAPSDGTKDKRFLDAISLFNYGFNNFNKKIVIEKSNFEFKIYDKQSDLEYTFGLKDSINILAKNEFKMTEIGYTSPLGDINFIKDIDKVQEKSIDFIIKNSEKDLSNISGVLILKSTDTIQNFSIYELLSKMFYICIILLCITVLLLFISKPKKGKKKHLAKYSEEVPKISRKARRRNH